MLYLDTSLFVAALINEQETAHIQGWLSGRDPDELAVSDWIATEFSSALSIKVRTGQTELAHRADALALFTRPVPRQFLTCFRCRGRSFAWRLGSSSNLHWGCVLEMRCISRSAPSKVLRSVRPTGGSARVARRLPSKRCCYDRAREPVTREWSGRSASVRRGRCVRGGGRCRSVRRIAARGWRDRGRQGRCGGLPPRNPR
jgi:hypothetical protein